MDKKLVLGFHLDFDTAGGDPPLWGYPWISMRGVPALRYQNESTGVLETELRWNILARWAAVGFVGVGASRGDVPIYTDESGIVAGGIGGRFLFRPQDSLWVGLDVAQGPEETSCMSRSGMHGDFVIVNTITTIDKQITKKRKTKWTR